MSHLSNSHRIFRFIGRFAMFLFQFSGFSRMIGYETPGLKTPRSVLDPVHSLDDEWKNSECDCNIQISDVDLSIF